MTQSRAYFLAGSKSAGLTRTPSIVAPSLLFQETTSRVPSVQAATWSVIRVRMRGPQGRSVTQISGRAVAVAAWKAERFPSLEKENPETIAPSGPLTRSIASDAGSRRKRWLAVFCMAEK